MREFLTILVAPQNCTVNALDAMDASATAISNVDSVIVKDSVFSTATGTQINNYNIRAALDVGKLCWRAYHALIWD